MSRALERSLVGILVAGAILVLAPAEASAQERVGVRVGVTIDPDQFMFGGHLETAPLVDRLSFRPNAEIGIGDGLVLVGLNMEFAYRIPLQNDPWTVLIGAGPALNILSFEGTRGRRGGDGTDLQGGFNFLVGVEHRDGLLAEFKVGALDSPGVKFVIGYSFN